MEFIASRFNPKDPALWMACLAILAGIAAAVIYPLTAANEFNPNISSHLILMLVLAVLAEAASVFFRFKEVKVIAFCLFLYDLVVYGGTQGNYLANLLRQIDGSKPSGSLIGMIACLAVSLLASLLSFILLKEAKAGEKAPKKEGE